MNPNAEPMQCQTSGYANYRGNPGEPMVQSQMNNYQYGGSIPYGANSGEQFMQTPMGGNNYPQADNYAENQNKIEEMQEKVEEEQTINYMIRRGFIIKTYGILLSQLAITCLFICLSFAKSVKEYLTSTGFYSSGFFIAFISIFVLVTIGVCIMFSCFTETAKKFPINYILLFAFTLSMSFYCLVFCSFFDTSDVIAAGLLTIAATIGLTVYAIKTKEDFTFCGGFLFSFTFLLVFSGCFYFWVGLTAVWLMLGIMIYSLYIVFDTQLIMGQLGLKYNIDDYCLAALNLYIDIIYLFLKILQLIGGRK